MMQQPGSNMDRHCRAVAFFSMSVLGIALCAGAFGAEKHPNIIFIMGDDLGWSDVGYNGAKFYETPNFDRLAADGMKFNRAYSGGPNCAPTRACIMTGTYTPRHQIWTPGGNSKGKNNEMKLLVPSLGNAKSNTFPSKTELDPSVISLAEVLKPAGYKTAMLGKWHLGDSEPQGFELFSADGTDAPYKDCY
ncbi:MAG: sulfatase-like hydrolase/transferase, partial [Bdellovibrionaceae bacterium]|nr:sulfatase-like hydrolase/transferase [Pseudobdellovibrionaceae bacterium]